MGLSYWTPMTHENARCLRPDCRFEPLPTLNGAGGLAVSPYCSEACRIFCVAAYYTANAEQTPETQRQLQQLAHLTALLDLRDHPAQYSEGLPTVEELREALSA
jgi:hypothetical protein